MLPEAAREGEMEPEGLWEPLPQALGLADSSPLAEEQGEAELDWELESTPERDPVAEEQREAPVEAESPAEALLPWDSEVLAEAQEDCARLAEAHREGEELTDPVLL